MKLKKIDIQAFRAYCSPGEGLFDFTNSNNETSNFITIYAPNGFGKTSFYDAVEWGFTNSVSRLQRDGKKLLPFAKSIENDKFIIRNKYADDNINCKVNIHLENQEQPITNTLDHSKIRKGQKDTKFNDQEVNDNNKFIKDVILAQDSINSFLREDDARLRYEKFITKFGDIKLSEQHRNLQKLFELSKNEEKSLRNKIDELEEKIDDNIDIDFIERINSQLSTLDDNYYSLGKISYPYTEKDLFDYESELLKGEHKIDSEIKTITSTVSNIELILSSDSRFTVTEYINNKNEIKQQLNSISSIESTIELAHHLEQLKRSRYIVEKNLKIENSNISLLKNTLSRYDSYKEARELISSIKSKHTDLLSENDDINRREKTIISDISIYEIKIRDTLKEIAKREKELDNSEHLYDQLSYFNKEKEYHESNLDILRNRIKDLKNNEIELNSQKNTLTSSLFFLDNKKYGDIQGFNLEKNQSEILSHIINTSKQIENIELKVKRLKEDLVFEDKLDEKIQVLSDEAINILKHKQGSNCPVCATHFDSTNSIIQAIIDGRSISYSNSKLRGEVNFLINKLADFNYELSSKESKLKSLIGERILHLDKQSFEVHQSMIKLSSECDKEQNKLNDIIDEIINIHKINGQKKKEEYESGLHSILERLSNELTDIEKTLESSNVELDSYLKKRNVLQHKIASIVAEIEALSNSTVILEQQSAYDDLNLEYNIEKHSINILLSREIKNADYSHEDISSYNNEITSIAIELNEDDLNTLQSNLLSLKTKVTNMTSINSHIEALISSELGIEVLPGTQKLIESLLLEAINKRKEQVNYLTSKKKKFSTVREYLGNALPYLDLVETNKKVDNLKQRFSFVREVIQPKIEEEINSVSDHIDKAISSFFYEDLINELYRRVDPHPDYVKIKFVSKFSSRDKPELHIVCTKKDEHKVIVPSLYFSSGQLNALSLCIFMAKALNVSDDKGNSIDFILIDDPVQAMDGLNILSTIDLLRGISISHNKQIVLSTHDESLFNLIKKKIPENIFGSKFISLESHGKVAQTVDLQ